MGALDKIKEKAKKMEDGLDDSGATKWKEKKGIGKIFAFIKHVIKDPINSIAEADARKKEVLICLFSAIGFAVACVALSNIPNAFCHIFFMVLYFPGFLAAFYCGILLFIIKKAKEKFRALTCKKCNKMAEIKTREDFEKYITYVVGENTATYEGISHPASNDGVVSEVTAKGEAHVLVTIFLTCPHCGNVKRINYFITPFECSATQKKVSVANLPVVKATLELAVKATIDDYNDLEKRAHIPYSIHSTKNPLNETRNTFKSANSPDAHPLYNRTTIYKYVDPEDIVEQFFLKNFLDGTIKDAEE